MAFSTFSVTSGASSFSCPWLARAERTRLPSSKMLLTSQDRAGLTKGSISHLLINIQSAKTKICCKKLSSYGRLHNV